MPISSLLGDALASAGTDVADDLSPLDVAVLHPGRTLLEKLYVVHGLARQVTAGTVDVDGLRRNGRHFYDIYMLLGHAAALSLLADRAQARQIMASIETVSQHEFGAAGELRPAGGFAASPAFDRDTDVSDQMRHAYESMMPALYFGAETLPAWDEICTRVCAHRHLL